MVWLEFSRRAKIGEGWCIANLELVLKSYWGTSTDLPLRMSCSVLFRSALSNASIDL